MTSPSSSNPGRPPIHMIDAEADRLTELALAREEALPQVCGLLLREINRASIHTARTIPDNIVVTVQLVYPGDADISAGRISILTPVGAGLIGLRKGQSIRWPDRDGDIRTLSIVDVATPAPTP